MSRKCSASSPVRPTMTSGAVCDFVRSCFTESLCEVDFTQALRAIEYLGMLDDRRKREVCAALRRLNIDEANSEPQKKSLKRSSPAAYERICSIEEKSRKAEALYTQTYIGLRRWALINEMRLMPFSRKSCQKVLDELYPAAYSKLPTPQLTQLILDNQRDAFSKYIRTVEKLGRSVLKNLENQSKRPTDDNGWPVVREILERYLRNTTRVIEVCTATKSLEMFTSSTTSTPTRSSPRSAATTSPSRETGRPSIGHSTTYPALPSRRPSASEPSSQLKKEQQEWLQQQQQRQGQKHEPAGQLKKSSSTLGRLAREFRRIKNKSVEERLESLGTHQRSHSAMENRPPLRARASFNTMSREPSKDGRHHSRAHSTERDVRGLATPQVQIDDAYRERLIEEAKRNKENKTKENKRRHSPTHFKLEEERRYNGTHRKQFVSDDAETDERYFYITDSATRSTPMAKQTPLHAATLREDRMIAELAA